MSLWRRIRPFFSSIVRLLRISYLEAKSGYQTSRLGLLWLPLGTLIFTAMLSLVFRHSEGQSSADFFLYVLSGYILWHFIQSSVVGSVDIIQKRLEFAVHNNMSLSGLFVKQLVDRIFEYSTNLALLVLAVCLISPDKFGAGILLFPAFLALIIVTSLALSYLVNISTVFFPDLSNIIRTGIRFLFFASPIFWLPTEGAGIRSLIVQVNPVAYYLEISRQVFGVAPLSANAWIWSATISFCVCAAGFVVFRSTKDFVRNIK